MKSFFSSASYRYTGTAFIFLCFALLFSNNLFSQDKMKKSACDANVAGYVDGYIIFACDRPKGDDEAPVCTIKEVQCACAAEKYKGAKGCIDANGKMVALPKKKDAMDGDRQKAKFKATSTTDKLGAAGSSNDKSNEARQKAKFKATSATDKLGATSSSGDKAIPAGEIDELVYLPQINFLAGQTNCRLRSELKLFLSYLAPEGHMELNLTKKGSGKNVRFNFIPIDYNNHSLGFYIASRGDDPYVLRLTSDNKVELRLKASMDGKMLEASQWKLFVDGQDKGGNSRYLIMPRDNPNKMVLAVDAALKQLVMVEKEDSSKDTLAARGADDEVLPSEKAKHWKCDCIF